MASGRPSPIPRLLCPPPHLPSPPRPHGGGAPSSRLLSYPFSTPLKPPSSLGVLRGQVVQGGHAETGNHRPAALLGQELVPHGLLGFVGVLNLGGGNLSSPQTLPLT